MVVPSTYSAQPHMPLLMHQDKFVKAAELFGYRVIHVPYEPCPEGSGGCVLCRGDRVGLHRREPAQTDVVDELRFDRVDRLPPLLSHRFRLTAATVTASVGGQVTTLQEGADFTVQGRLVVFGAVTPDRQTVFAVSYRAYAESWVHMQHAYGDFGGLKRQSERDKFQKLGFMPQGSILMSINHTNPGYDLMTGDVFIPVDGSVKVPRHIVAGRTSNRSQHRFVHHVERAYAVDAQAEREYPVNVTFDAATLELRIEDDLEDQTKVAVVYRAAPQFFVFLDGGEFRHPLGQDHQRLVILSKLETTV